MKRDRRSVPPPAAQGQITVIVLLGYAEEDEFGSVGLQAVVNNKEPTKNALGVVLKSERLGLISR